MQAMGGLVAAWEVWERALIPSLLSGAGSWLGDIKEAVKLANQILKFYWRIILKVPESCPKWGQKCKTNATDVQWRVWKEKCLLLIRIKALPDGSLAKIVYEEAESRGWPGLGKEVRQICQSLGLPDINKHNVSKTDVKKAIQKDHYKDMLSQFESSRKLKDIKHDNFTTFQNYFNDRNLQNARMKFKIRTKMLDKIPGNFKNKYQNRENGLKCNLCNEEMTQDHCKICPERCEAREGLDMNNLDDLVTYFQLILSDKSLHWEEQLYQWGLVTGWVARAYCFAST